ncbi:MAG TPA: hypothetical protein VMT52_08330 [Planctomycetota bacterium]|nr:hypothetical protein [Planctomycetota bacterium]
MSFIRPSGSKSPPADVGLALVLLASILGGCAQAGWVHPGYSERMPHSIAVLPVRNETVHQLDAVSFGGFAQRMIIGAPTFDIPDLLRGSLEESLIQAGYEAARPAPGSVTAALESGKALPEDASAIPFDAALHTAIEGWQADTGSVAGIRMRYRVELRSIPGAEVLFSGVFPCVHREDPRARGTDEVPNAVRRSAKQALGALPRRAP